MIGYGYGVLIADKRTDGSIRSWLNNDLVPALTVLHRAEAFIYRRLRVREMLATATGTIAASDDTLSLPDRYLAPRYLGITGTEAMEIKRKPLEEVERAFAYDAAGALVAGKPTIYCAHASVLQFDCPADADYPYRFVHYAEPAPLTTDNPTNVLTDRAFNALFCVGMAYACEWAKEDGKDEWLIKAAAEIDTLNAEDDQEMAGIEMAVRVI